MPVPLVQIRLREYAVWFARDPARITGVEIKELAERLYAEAKANRNLPGPNRCPWKPPKPFEDHPLIEMASTAKGQLISATNGTFPWRSIGFNFKRSSGLVLVDSVHVVRCPDAGGDHLDPTTFRYERRSDRLGRIVWDFLRDKRRFTLTIDVPDKFPRYKATLYARYGVGMQPEDNGRELFALGQRRARPPRTDVNGLLDERAYSIVKQIHPKDPQSGFSELIRELPVSDELARYQRETRQWEPKSRLDS